MKPGISSYTFPWKIGFEEKKNARLFPDVMDLLSEANQHGIGYVQICDNLPLSSLTTDQLNLVQERASALGIKIQPGTRGLSVANVRGQLALAARFGSPFIRMVIDDNGYHPSVEEVVVEIRKILPDLEKAAVILAIENHDRFPATALKHIIESTSKKFTGICLDTANSLGAGEGVKEVVGLLGPYTVNLHIKDISIKRFSHKMGFTVSGAPAGQGQLDLRWIIDTITSQHPGCETCTLELWADPLASRVENIAQERVWAEQSINFLKQILS